MERPFRGLQCWTRWDGEQIDHVTVGWAGVIGLPRRTRSNAEFSARIALNLRVVFFRMGPPRSYGVMRAKEVTGGNAGVVGFPQAMRGSSGLKRCHGLATVAAEVPFEKVREGAGPCDGLV